MQFNSIFKRFIPLLLILTMTLLSVTGCTKQDETIPPDPAANDPVAAQTGGNDALTFRPADLGMPTLEQYDYPYAGFSAILTDTLRSKMDTQDVVMLSDETYTEDGQLRYALISWYALTEAQKNETVTALDPEAWKKSLCLLGSLGVYDTESTANLDAITACSEHITFGKSADGRYEYYLSINAEADEALAQELRSTQVSIIEMQEIDRFLGKTAFSEARIDTSSTGEWTTTDINGTEYTNALFQQYDLTLVNVFTTWCSACLDEMPALEKLQQQLADQGIGVVGIVYDSITPTGDQDSSVLQTAQLLQQKLNLSFPLLIPDATAMNGRLKGIDAFPESFLVDRKGNIVGDSYLGARSYEEWADILQKELAKQAENRS